VYYLWGREGVANKDVIRLNGKDYGDLNCTIEIKYIDSGHIDTKFPCCLPPANFDMSHASPTPSLFYYRWRRREG
jgi:hypothetical protein